MGAKTRIDWCDSTWNPVTGCLHGCEYCYARGIANRFGLDYCRLLNDGVRFECKELEMDFYAPHYDAATYYCADGKRREEHGTETPDRQ